MRQWIGPCGWAPRGRRDTRADELTFKTVQGAALTARLAGNSVAISDANGGTAMVTKADLASSNGVIHVTDAVSLPK